MAAKKKNFETILGRVEEIIAALEKGDQDLENGMALYREGLAAAKTLRGLLDQARHDLSRWQEDGASGEDSGNQGKVVPLKLDDKKARTPGEA